MYDSHMYCKKYRELKNLNVDIINGDEEVEDIEELKHYVYELYENEELQATQYDDLVSYLDEL